MLKIGWSKRDVSTDKPVMINGQFYMRVSKGVLDPIMLNCLVVENNDDMVIFLSGDFVNAHGCLDVIRGKLTKARPGFPAEKLIFNVTHTHCGPMIMVSGRDNDTVCNGLEILSPNAYRDFMSDMAVEAILEAWDNRQEGAIAYGYGFAVVAHSRRTLYMDDTALRPSEDGLPVSLSANGHAIMYGNTNDDMFSGFEGGADHYINLMYTFDKAGKLTGAVINVPCPSQNSELETRLTADYWHDVRQILHEKYGDIGILSQCGAAGDLAPRVLHYLPAEERRFRLKYADTQLGSEWDFPREKLRRMDIASRICDAFDEVLSWAGKELIYDAPVVHTVKDITLEKRMVTDEMYKDACEQIANLEANAPASAGETEEEQAAYNRYFTGINRFKGIVKRYEEQKVQPETMMELHTVRIGDIAFATNPFELFIDYQHRIQARSPFVQTCTIQLCAKPNGNYSSGYLATERGIANKGYSAAIFDNQVSPNGGNKLVEETLAQLKAIADK